MTSYVPIIVEAKASLIGRTHKVTHVQAAAPGQSVMTTIALLTLQVSLWSSGKEYFTCPIPDSQITVSQHETKPWRAAMLWVVI